VRTAGKDIGAGLGWTTSRCRTLDGKEAAARRNLQPEERAMTYSIEEKHRVIRERDELFAFELAKMLIDKPKAPIWIILLPMLFIFYAHWLQRYKSNIAKFSKEYMHTKRIALDAAFDSGNGGDMPVNGWADFLGGTSDGRIEIKELQYEELDLLMGHYQLLLGSQGQDYPALIRSSYRTSGEYRFFLNRLVRVEERINKAVLRIDHPTPDARDVVRRMERFADQLRERELARIFR
jgi:hypothetical protein